MELLSCHFLASGEDIVRQQITFRYNSVKARSRLSPAALFAALPDWTSPPEGVVCGAICGTCSRPSAAVAPDAPGYALLLASQSRLALMQARLADVNALVKIKNPSLLLQLQRTPQRMPPGANARGGRPY